MKANVREKDRSSSYTRDTTKAHQDASVNSCPATWAGRNTQPVRVHTVKTSEKHGMAEQPVLLWCHEKPEAAWTTVCERSQAKTLFLHLRLFSVKSFKTTFSERTKWMDKRNKDMADLQGGGQKLHPETFKSA